MPDTGPPTPRIAIVIPCSTRRRRSASSWRFRGRPAEATIYVYDNNSTDDTERAAPAGAIVRTEPLQGKGNVVRRMFADVEADAYVLVDGDGTYDAACGAWSSCCWRTRSTWSTARASRPRSAYPPGPCVRQQAAHRRGRGIFGNR